MSTNRILGTKIPSEFARERAPGMRIDSGPYLATVKDSSDQLFQGRLRVYIPEFGGDPDDERSWTTVNYASPFFGEVDPAYGQPRAKLDSKYGQTKHSYGMWFVPPDFGSTVLVTFATGNPDLGYWFACIPTPRGHQMVPGLGASTYYQEKSDIGATKKEFSQVPVTEGKLDARLDILALERPVHIPQFSILRDQGIAVDTVRGSITSTSQRETPSRVFGFSTPGRPDPDPAYEPDQIKLDANFADRIISAASGTSSALADEIFKPKARKGGHTLVMDDGGLEGNNQLVRLRSATGHQILMHDTKGIFYIINSLGTAWVEMTPDGSINVFSGGDISMRAQGGMNFHADEDMRFHAGGSITMKAATGSLVVDSNKSISLKAKESLIADGNTLLLMSDNDAVLYGKTLSISSSGDLSISGSVDISSSGGSKPGLSATLTDQQFTETEKSGLIWKPSETNTTASTVSILPTHEPWARPPGQENIEDARRLNVALTNENISVNTSTNRVAATSLPEVSENPVQEIAPQRFSPDKGTLQTIPKNLRITAAQIDAQPDPPGSIGNLTVLQTKALFAQLALRESTFRYNVAGGRTESGVYTGNYLGKYQMGAEALAGAGFIDEKRLQTDYQGRKTYAVRDDSVWLGKNGVKSKTDFLNNGAAQEAAMYSFTKTQYTDLVKSGTIKSGDSPEEVMGKLTTAHLLGVGPAAKLFKTGIDGQDANKTWGKSYYELGRHAANVAYNIEYTRTLASK
jgi:hypothetical protein